MSSATVILDIQSINEINTNNIIDSALTIDSNIKTLLTNSSDPSLNILATTIQLDPSNIAISEILSPVGPVTYSNTEEVEVPVGWVLVGNGTRKAIRSFDGGNTWVYNAVTAISDTIQYISYGKDASQNKVMVGVGTGGAAAIYSTDNGTSWIRGTPTNLFGAAGKFVMQIRNAQNIPVWYAFGAANVVYDSSYLYNNNGTQMAYSYNGINWTRSPMVGPNWPAPFSGSNYPSSIEYVGYDGVSKYVAVGPQGCVLSEDYCQTWIPTYTAEGARSCAYGTDINGVGKWLVVTWNSKIISSIDGITWTVVLGTASPQRMPISKIVKYINDKWYIGGNATNAGGGGAIQYTNDCITFNRCTLDASADTIHSIGYGQTSDGSPLFYAGGDQGSYNNLFKSYDGISWTNITNKTSLMSNAVYCINYNVDLVSKPIYLHFTPGTPNLYGSINGINTTTTINSPFSTAINKIKWNGTIWVGVGEGTNTIAYSTDGVIWNGLGTSLFSIRGTNIIWNTTMRKWYAYGEGTNTELRSTDGINWNSV